VALVSRIRKIILVAIAIIVAIIMTIVINSDKTTNETNAIMAETVSVPKSNIDSANVKKVFTSRYSAQFDFTAPTFQFEYPNNWVIDDSNIDETREIVELQNEHGVTIMFSQGFTSLGNYNVGIGGQAVKVANTHIPEIAVAKFTTSIVYIRDEGDVTDGRVNETYAIYPARWVDDFGSEGSSSYAGPGIIISKFEYINKSQFDSVLNNDMSQYGGIIAFACDIPVDGLNAQEEKEVLEILSSFRQKESG
jgi:hypothetical protein